MTHCLLKHTPFLRSVVAEPLYGLGFPRRRYVAQHFDCASPLAGLRSCRYDTLIDARCYDGPHVAGMRCIESKGHKFDNRHTIL